MGERKTPADVGERFPSLRYWPCSQIARRRTAVRRVPSSQRRSAAAAQLPLNPTMEFIALILAATAAAVLLASLIFQRRRRQQEAQVEQEIEERNRDITERDVANDYKHADEIGGGKAFAPSLQEYQRVRLELLPVTATVPRGELWTTRDLRLALMREKEQRLVAIRRSHVVPHVATLLGIIVIGATASVMTYRSLPEHGAGPSAVASAAPPKTIPSERRTSTPGWSKPSGAASSSAATPPASQPTSRPRS